jgi:LysM repeat protein
MKSSWPFIILVTLTIVVVGAAGERVWRLSQQSTIEPTTTSVAPSPLPSTVQPITPDTSVASTTPETVVPTQTAIATETPPLPTNTPLPQPQTFIAYRVKEGDTLEGIAQASGSLPELIRDYNRLNSDIYLQRPLSSHKSTQRQAPSKANQSSSNVAQIVLLLH